MPAKTSRLSNHQQALFAEKTKKAFKDTPHLKKLHKHLLKIGGIAVVLWNGTNDEVMTDKLLQSGQTQPGAGAVLRLGERSECHENSAKLHRKDPSRYEVRIGYALSKDGIWRPHSWVIDGKSGKIIETTEKRVTYFGVIKFQRESSPRD